MSNKPAGRRQLLLASFAMAMASGSVGALVGYLASQGTVEPLITVMSTIIVTGGVGLFSGFKLDGDLMTTKVIPSINIVVFTGSLFLSTIAGETYKNRAEVDYASAQLQAIYQCSYEEWKINSFRTDLALTALEGICDPFLTK